MSAFKSLFFTLLYDNGNFNIFDTQIVSKLCDIFSGSDEVKIINRVHEEFSKFNVQHLNIPESVRKVFGQSVDAFVKFEAAKTHARKVSFCERGNGYECESSDLCFVIDYVLYMPTKFLSSRSVSFVQLKLGEFGKPWRLSNNQLYFMRYWPPFRYQNKPYDLDIFRAYPDLGSFYLFIYKDKTLTDTFTRQARKRYRVNGYALSSLMIEYALRHHILLRPSGNYEHVDDSILNILRNNRRCAFFLWKLLFQDLGLYSVDAESFIKCLYPSLFNNDPPEDGYEVEERPSVGVKVEVGLKMAEDKFYPE